ncbi:PD-(D/E)XK nuclease family protein [Treponema sp.]|uniref:PD-(D/E)XK nuclease family protein n=1 Tax=Treponema sp. TaxID=166 RepID=UPI003F01AC1F
MNISDKTVSQVVAANISNINSIFVFPTDVAQTSWIQWAIKNPSESGVRAFNLDQFTAWDKFKSAYLKAADENLVCIPPVVRKVFVQNILLENSEKHFFKRIVSSAPEFKDNVLGFADWIAGILPSLKLWNSCFEKSMAKKNPDEEDLDYKKLFELYSDFLSRNNFYEPSYLDSDLKKTDRNIFIFYPELLEDFSEFQTVLSAAENVTLVNIPDNIPKTACCFYSDSRRELRMLALRLHQLHIQNVDLRTVAVNVPDLETLRPYLERELSLYSVPYTVRAGVPFTKNCGGDIFQKIKECASSNFSYDSVRSFLLDGYIPWKNFERNEQLVRTGNEKRCVCNYVDGDKTTDVWLSSLQNENGELDFYKNIKKAVLEFENASSFQKLKFAWDNFKSTFIDEAKFSEAQYQNTDKILGRIITELNSLVSIEHDYLLKIGCKVNSPFVFFINEINRKSYTPNEKKYGVNIFPYRLSVCADFEYQFVINATQKDISVPFRKLGFINDSEKRANLDLGEKDASADFIRVYCAQQRTLKSKKVFFSASKKTFSGSAIMHTALEPSAPDCGEEKILEELDFINNEKNDFRNEKKSERIFTKMQQDSFFLWKSVFSSGNSSCMSEELKKKINAELKNKGKNCSEPDKIKISQTELKSFFPCPRHFIFTKVLNLKEDTLDVDLIKNYEAGVFIHKIIELVCKAFQDEKVYKGKIPVFCDENSRELKNLVDLSFEQAKLHTGFSRSPLALSVIESQKKLICENVFVFFKQFCALPESSDEKENKNFGGYFIEGLELEKETSCGSGEFDFFGKIDCVLSNPDEPDELFIVDYKSGSVPSVKDSVFNESSLPALKDFQMASYVRLLESEGKKVCSALFYKLKRENSDNFSVVQVISKNPKKENTDREGFENTLAELEICAEYFYGKAKELDFVPVSFQVDKSHGVNIFRDCMNCGFNSICRTSFEVAKKELV